MRINIPSAKLRGAQAALLALLATACARESPPPLTQDADLRHVVALLDYVAGDYGSAVKNGEVVSAAEFEEQQGFVADAADLAKGSGEPRLAERIQRLGELVRQKAPADRVAAEATAIRDALLSSHAIPQAPPSPPSKERGATLHASACASCHGQTGAGDGPAARDLSTPPRSYLDPAAMKDLSPSRVFNSLSFGVPGTAMPSYEEALDARSRWDLAFYVFDLAHAQGDLKGGQKLAEAASLAPSYARLSTLSDGALRKLASAAGLSGPQAADALSYLRRVAAYRPAGGARLAKARDRALEAARLYGKGQAALARRELLSAYLDDFEPHEAALRAKNGARVVEIEHTFLALRAQIESGQPASQVAAAAARLGALIDSASQSAGPPDRWIAFLASLAIALREGVEVALIIAALLALLRKSGRESSVRAVHAGWLLALAAGAATWWLSGELLQGSGATRELVEGAMQLVTAALLLYASHWLLAAAAGKRLLAFVQEKVAVAGSSLLAVAGLAFALSYREMVEVVLFYRGLLLESGDAGSAVAAGAVAGLLALIVLAALFQRLGVRLKPRPLLLACGMLLTGLAVVMVGHGVRALQEAAALPLTLWGTAQIPSLGLYATREGLLAQGLLIAGIAASAAWTLARKQALPEDLRKSA